LATIAQASNNQDTQKINPSKETRKTNNAGLVDYQQLMAIISVIEDDPMFVKLIGSALEQLEHSARFYADGASGLTGIYDHPPDLLILDLNLPDADGIDIARTVREHPELNTIPILMLTARTDLDSRVRGLQYADDYLGKPFVLEELSARILALLRRSRAAQENKNSDTPLNARELAGKTIKHYQLHNTLGEGSMSIVYHAFDTRLKRPIAMKFITNAFSDDTVRERFLREAKAASRLEHVNICPVLTIDELASGEMFLVMPFFEGETLEDVLTKGRLSYQQACDYALQIAKGLAQAHAHNIIHRDIKPGNAFVTDDGIVKLLDFGIAKWQGQAIDTNLTQPGTLLGTVNYMAPEQVRGQTVGAAADCWSLGVVFYEMLTGRLPFEAERHDLVRTLSSIVRGQYTPLLEVRPDVPEMLVDIVSRILQKDPAARYKTMTALAHDLRRARYALTQSDT
jgi:CheY-like chemotaxis protein/tRNA A-37 threonylcarbamoyl transferase component Bud32